MNDVLPGIDGDEANVTVFITPDERRRRAREAAMARQRRESLTSTAFVVIMFLIAVLPLLWAGIR